MRVKVKLPQWGMSMVDGTVVRWLKNEGEAVHVGDDLVEVEIEKAVNMLQAPTTGRISKILVSPGEVAMVQDVLCEIEVG